MLRVSTRLDGEAEEFVTRREIGWPRRHEDTKQEGSCCASTRLDDEVQDLVTGREIGSPRRHEDGHEGTKTRSKEGSC
jgi:hypothetical protein